MYNLRIFQCKSDLILILFDKYCWPFSPGFVWHNDHKTVVPFHTILGNELRVPLFFSGLGNVSSGNPNRNPPTTRRRRVRTHPASPGG